MQVAAQRPTFGQVGAVCCEAAALNDIVAEVQCVQRLLDTVRVESIAPKLLRRDRQRVH